MRSLLKLILLLLCVQRGAGRHWIRSLLDQRRDADSPTGSPDGDETRGPRPRAPEDDTRPVGQSLGAGQSPHRQPPASRSRRSSPSSSSSSETSRCSLRSILLRVRDLGLGYDSDETVLFKYCGGACPRVPSNHDLTLSNLLLTGVLAHDPAAPGGEDLLGRRGGAPCCRPTRHEDMAFLDNSHRWHRVEKLSAAGCSCVG